MQREVKLDSKELMPTKYRHYYAGRDGHIYRHVKKTANLDKESLVLFTTIPYYYFMMVPEYKSNERANNLQVSLSINGNMTTLRVDKLIAEAWLPKRNNDWKLAHLDGDNLNNKPENLIWVFNKDLYDILSEEEFTMWSAKLDSLPAFRCESFNTKLLEGYIDNYFELQKYPEKRKEFFEKHLKIK